MAQKSKGSNKERNLVHMFHDIEGWSAVRVAGSGTSRYPSPDILAGKEGRSIAIECKSTRKEKKYLDKEEIKQIKTFGERFGAEIWIGIRFLRMPWYFMKIKNLEDTGKNLAVSQELAKKEGITLEELTTK